jgi:glycosyltransferase involved in cell wall biosynthesis
MKVVVVHPSLNRGGGAEKVCLAVVKALGKKGHKVRLNTIDRVDWLFLKERFGEVFKPLEEVYLIENMPIRGKFSQAALTISRFLPELFYLMIKDEYDLVVNTYGDMADSMGHVAYVNALPARVVYHYPGAGLFSSIGWRLFSHTYDSALKFVDAFFAENVLLANSGFTQDVVRRFLGRESMVVYPPVDVGKFKRAAEEANREKHVVTVSRLRTGKNLQLIPQVAKIAEQAEFTVIGLADQASGEAIKVFAGFVKNLGVKERVRLLLNVPFERLASVLASAKVFLHTQSTEAFGISIVEAMASGCVPIVPRNGGPWFDILDQKQGEYGYSYVSVQEAAEIIKMLMKNEDLREEVSARARERAMTFDSSVFESEIVGVIEKAYSRKFG